MRHALPYLWFSLGGIVLFAGALLPLAFGPDGDTAGLLALSLPQAGLFLPVSVAVGLVYMLLGRVRPSGAVTVFGVLHLAAAIISQGARLLAEGVRQRLVSGAPTDLSLTREMGYLYAGSALLAFLGWVFFIAALAIALNSKPPAEEAF